MSRKTLYSGSEGQNLTYKDEHSLVEPKRPLTVDEIAVKLHKADRIRVGLPTVWEQYRPLAEIVKEAFGDKL